MAATPEGDDAFWKGVLLGFAIILVLTLVGWIGLHLLIDVAEGEEIDGNGTSYDRRIPIDGMQYKYDAGNNTATYLFVMSDESLCVTKYRSVHLEPENWYPETNTCPVDRPLYLLLKEG